MHPLLVIFACVTGQASLCASDKNLSEQNMTIAQLACAKLSVALI